MADRNRPMYTERIRYREMSGDARPPEDNIIYMFSSYRIEMTLKDHKINPNKNKRHHPTSK